MPTGLAGVDIAELLDEAEASLLEVAIDSPDNPALVLAAAIAGTSPRRDKLGLITDGTHIVGLPDWIEQLVAESTGKNGTGILPVVLLPVSPEVENKPDDLQIVRLVDEAKKFHLFEHHEGEILVSGSLGGQLMVWEYATAIAGRMLGINPFDQPDVESAKIATRALLDARPEPTPPAFTVEGVEVRVSDPELAASGTVAGVLDALWKRLPADGYVAIQAYVNRLELPQLLGLRELVAADSGSPDDVRLGPALPALHRSVPQGRTRPGRVPADPRAHRRRSRDPRPALHLRPAHRGTGRGRREGARRARPPRRDPDPHRSAARSALALRSRPVGAPRVHDRPDLARAQPAPRPR